MSARPDVRQNAMSGRRTAVGLDVGGTKIAAAVVADNGEILSHRTVRTPVDDSGPVVLRMLVELISELQLRHPDIEGVGVGAAGIVEWPSGKIRWAPNNSYVDVSLRQDIQQATGLPTTVDNDANTVAWAEACVGAGVGIKNLLALTVGTGVGGGLVLDGQLYRGPSGVGMEVGHLVVDARGADLCGCGNRGCLEAVASGTALGRIGQKAAVEQPLGRIASTAGGPTSVTGHTVYQSARLGDDCAIRLFAEVGDWLGIGVASLVNLFDVQQVVIGGGLVGTGDFLLAPMRRSYGRHVFARRHRPVPPIVAAQFGPEAGLVGAAMLVLRQGGVVPAPGSSAV